MGSVVINEYEVLRDAQPQQGGVAASDDGNGAPEPLEPHDVKDALLALQAHALRTWAH